MKSFCNSFVVVVFVAFNENFVVCFVHISNNTVLRENGSHGKKKSHSANKFLDIFMLSVFIIAFFKVTP